MRCLVSVGFLLLAVTLSTQADSPKDVPKEISPQTAEGLLAFTPGSPVYPEEAQKKHIEGAVLLRVVIAKDGKVKSVAVVKGHPLLTSSAVNAVKLWRYMPYYVNYEPVEVRTTITVTYKLTKPTANNPAKEPDTRPIISKTGNRYLRPDDFGSVPVYVRSQLNARHCLIPQDVETVGPTNLENGEFSKPGQQDLAAYCSVEGKSRVIVIWGGPSHCDGEPFGLKSFDDDSLVRNADPQQWGRTPPRGSFWKLSVIRRAGVIARQKRGITLGHPLKSASHDALQRTSIAGANGVYCENGKWRELWYAD